jgi:hypothetical protein
MYHILNTKILILDLNRSGCVILNNLLMYLAYFLER